MSEHKRSLRGLDVLADPELNKATAFSLAERRALGLEGLLPSRVGTQPLQVTRVWENLQRKEYDIERYIFLSALQGRNERLFYRTLLDHIEEVMPLVYTPTVGQACKEFAHIFRQPRGFYICPGDRGNIARILKNWPHRDVRVVVVTDGERILGLGDLGANGMGIPIGKLALYTGLAGIHPDQCLPVQLDVGTNNEELLEDPLYLGVPQRRIEGDEYFSLVEEFVTAVQEQFPKVLIQFEDFLTPNAFDLLRRYRDRVLCFNDDIQGTACVALAGVYAALRVTRTDYHKLKIMFLGAGSAAVGIGDLITEALVESGLSESDARRRLWFVDSKGLIVKGRERLKPHSIHYAHEHAEMDFLSALKDIQPHILIGATGRPGMFTEEVVKAMSSFNERPVVFALSNPTSRAECTAEQAYRWSDGRVVFASGSPFPAIQLESGEEWRPGQGNNAYVFPGIGLGVVGCEVKRVTDGMFLAAARALADETSEDDLAHGTLYPSLKRIREVSLSIAVSVAQEAYSCGLAKLPKPADLRGHLAASMYDPTY